VNRKLGALRKLLLDAIVMTAVAPILLGLINATPGGAKPQTIRKQFEVASIKPNKSADTGRAFVPQSADRISATNVTLRELLRIAYNLQDFQISGGPSWIDSSGYDIEAKAGTEASPPDLQLMLQSLLAERFNLVVHRDRKEAPAYALVVSRNGNKLKPSDPSKCVPPPAGLCGVLRALNGLIIGEQITTEQFSFRLSRSIGRTIVDKTGLTGIFDLRLEWQPDQIVTSPEAPPLSQRPSLMTAIQEQLGLKLDSDKTFVDTLVIDRVEKPSDN